MLLKKNHYCNYLVTEVFLILHEKKKSEEDCHILDAYKSLSPEERKLVSDYIDTLTSAHRGREKLSRDDSLHSGEVFRAAKSSGGNASPGRERLSEEDLGRISSAPETDEDL